MLYVFLFFFILQLMRNSNDDEFAVGETSGRVKIYHLDSERPLYSLQPTINPVTSVDWSPTNPDRLLAFAAGECLVWDKSISALPEIAVEISTELNGVARYLYSSFHHLSYMSRWSRVSERIVAIASLNSLSVYRIQEKGRLAVLLTQEGHATEIAWHAVSSSCVAAMGSTLLLISSGM